MVSRKQRDVKAEKEQMADKYQQLIKLFKKRALKVKILHSVIRPIQKIHSCVFQVNIHLELKKQAQITNIYLDPPHSMIAYYSRLSLKYAFAGNRSGLYRLKEEEIMLKLRDSADSIVLVEKLMIKPSTPVNLTFAGTIYPFSELEKQKALDLRGWKIGVEYDYFKTETTSFDFHKPPKNELLMQVP